MVTATPQSGIVVRPIATVATSDLDTQLAPLLTQANVSPLSFDLPTNTAQIKLGEALFFDKELSGNRDIACATCHHPSLASGDGLSLSLGTGAVGLGSDRELGYGRSLIARNALPVFNLASPDWTTLFWDGRLVEMANGRFDSPAEQDFPNDLPNIIAAQAMFPVVARDEMRGDFEDNQTANSENELAWFGSDEEPEVWAALMVRLMAIPGYVALFNESYPEVATAELHFSHAATALAAYQMATFSFNDAPFDSYLRGDTSTLSDEAKRGAILFFGDAGCAGCHNGSLLSDQEFHNIGVPQIGPGKSSFDELDFGRALESDDPDADAFKFRTPSLHNIAVTAPYMHNGAYLDLESAVRHHLDPVTAINNFDPSNLADLVQEDIHDDFGTVLAVLTTLDPKVSQPISLTEAQMGDLLSFLESLTATSALDLAHTLPDSVPSGLSVQD